MRRKNKKHWARSQKKKVTRKIRFNHGILFKVLLAIFLGVATYSFVFSNFLEVTEIEISGLETLDREEIELGVREIISEKYLGIIPKNNIVFILTKGFNQELVERFKKIETIETSKNFPNKISINIKERKLILILCSQGNCFFVDKSGYAYASVNFNSEEVQQNKLVKLIDESGKLISEGDLVLRPGFVEFIFSIADEIKENSNVEITNEYRSKSLISEEVIVQTGKGWDIYLSSSFPVEKSARILKTILNKQISLKEANNLEYIDLRSENKVFYRMKGDGAKEEKIEEEKTDNKENTGKEDGE